MRILQQAYSPDQGFVGHAVTVFNAVERFDKNRERVDAQQKQGTQIIRGLCPHLTALIILPWFVHLRYPWRSTT
ncbi:hypothetical protein HBI24_151520 [Parastagonospora nodorum]|nr:hypothetical protein HBI47_098080 [Parastagonospora nodorum]KAH5579867.1 hypothetical protein HBI24_151520 [Parastagonospora nodorum]